jgi:hypothetical protein
VNADAQERRDNPPIVTGVVWVVTAVTTAAQLVDRRVLVSLERDPHAVHQGAWWRVLQKPPPVPQIPFGEHAEQGEEHEVEDGQTPAIGLDQ